VFEGSTDSKARLVSELKRHPIRLRAGLDDVSLIGQPVEHGLAEPGIGKRPVAIRKTVNSL
jgi:hypothetical protein